MYDDDMELSVKLDVEWSNYAEDDDREAAAAVLVVLMPA
jgi:hypothetical protein